MTPSRRNSLPLIAALVFSGALAKNLRGQTKAGVPSDKTERITDAEIGPNGNVRIWLKSGKSIQPPPDPAQAVCEAIAISADGLSAGWLVAQNNLFASYSVAVGLDVFRLGKPMRHFGNGLMLIDWQFIDDDKQVQFSSSQLHGPGTDWHTMEIHDIETGRLLRMWREPTDQWVVEATFGPVRGRVTDAAGNPIPDVAVTIRSDPRAEPIALIPTTERGEFEIPTILPGNYELRFEHPGFKTRATTFTMDSFGHNVDVGTVTLSPAPHR
jgi:hypothetical protein